MTWRKDKFKVGDKVTWSAEYKYDWMVKQYGQGPFTLTRVIDRPLEPRDDFELQSNWESMGHTQHVWIEGHLENMISGAFFKLVEGNNG